MGIIPTEQEEKARLIKQLERLIEYIKSKKISESSIYVTPIIDNSFVKEIGIPIAIGIEYSVNIKFITGDSYDPWS